MENEFIHQLEQELSQLSSESNLRMLPLPIHHGRDIEVDGKRMLNLSSNDYLGVASDCCLRQEFLQTLTPELFIPSASSSRLLTGNFAAYTQLELLLCQLFRSEAALVLASGYHANTGILPAISNAQTLILADKLVHASLIDGIRLSKAQCIRYRHANYEQLEQLVSSHRNRFERIVIVTESLFSMDGDVTDLQRLVQLKKSYPNVLLYVDEAHAVGVRGAHGLGCAEEQHCLEEIDFLVGTFGKAIASVGAYVLCKQSIRSYLVNKMRTLIFSTALPPLNLVWTAFVLERITGYEVQRKALAQRSRELKEALILQGHHCPSDSHIVPLTVGDSSATIALAKHLQRKGYYALPVRPPTVPQGSSRIRFSLTATVTRQEVQQLINSLQPDK